MRRCQTLTSKFNEPKRLCNKPATWHAAEGLQVKAIDLCDEHMAAFVECCGHYCHPDGWRYPERIDATASTKE